MLLPGFPSLPGTPVIGLPGCGALSEEVAYCKCNIMMAFVVV